MPETDIQPYVPLKTVVSYFLDQHDKSMGDFDKAWVIAFRALVALGFSISFEPITVRLPVAGNKTVKFPPDCISWTKVGVLNNVGEVSTLRINNALTTYRDTSPNRISRLTPDVQSAVPAILGFPFFFNYYDNGLYYNLFGVGGGLIQYGSCRIDEKNRLVVLEPDFQYSSIIFEYISSPQKNGDYSIQIQLQEAVIAFIEWKLKLNTDQNFYARAIEARATLPGKKVSLQTINQVLREPNGMKLRS
jgi:hypothetical protein